MHIEDLEPTARHLLHNISRYIHIELLGTTINLNYTEEGVRNLAAHLLEVHNEGYNLAILESVKYETKV